MSVGLQVEFSGTDLRGPALKSHTTLSVSPSKWQLEHACQPSDDRRSLMLVVCPGSRWNSPRDEKNMSAPTKRASSTSPDGAGAVRTTRMTRSFRRSTTVTLRERTFAT